MPYLGNRQEIACAFYRNVVTGEQAGNYIHHCVQPITRAQAYFYRESYNGITGNLTKTEGWLFSGYLEAYSTEVSESGSYEKQRIEYYIAAGHLVPGVTYELTIRRETGVIGSPYVFDSVDTYTFTAASRVWISGATVNVSEQDFLYSQLSRDDVTLDGSLSLGYPTEGSNDRLIGGYRGMNAGFSYQQSLRII